VTLSDSISWEYLPLEDITITAGVAAPQIRLCCVDDEGGPQFLVHCDDLSIEALLPYAELLRAWKADPYTVEKPVIPVYLASGRYYFSSSGACFDYPHLKRPTGWSNFTRHYSRHRQLSSQIQNAAKTQTSTAPELALTPFIKKST
jgi:hypothetical protein